MGRTLNGGEVTGTPGRSWAFGRLWRWGATTDPGEPGAAAAFPPPDGRPTPAQQLRDGRMRRGLSLKEVSTQTKIGLAHLENIEQENFSRLPARAYLKGFVFSFARAVRLPDPAAVTEAYLARFDETRRATGPH